MDRQDSIAGVGDPGSKNEGSVAGIGEPGREADHPVAGEEEPRPTTAATGSIQAPDAPASLDLNALHKMSPQELAEVAKKFGVFLHPARTRHYQILDLVRAGLGAG